MISSLSFLFALFILVGTIHAQSSLSIGGLYLTMRSSAGSFPVTLEPFITPPDPSQAWRVDTINGAITSWKFPGEALNIAGAYNNAPVQVVGGAVNPTSVNQLWNIYVISGSQYIIQSQVQNAYIFLAQVQGSPFLWVDTTPSMVTVNTIAFPPTPIPTMPPTIAPTKPPTAPPTAPPSVPPTMPPTIPPTIPPTMPPTMPPTKPPTMPPTIPPTVPPTVPPTAPPSVAPTKLPTIPPTAAPTFTKTPLLCVAFADVHYTSFLATNFDNQGVGFFRLANIGVYAVMTLTKVLAPGISANQALMFLWPSNTIQVTENDMIRINGDLTVMATGTSITISGVTILKNSVGLYTISFPGGNVRYEQYSVNVWANIYITVYPGSPTPTGMCTLASFKRSTVQNPGQAWGEQFRVTNAAETGYTFTDKTFDELNNVNFVQNYGPYTADPGLTKAANDRCSEITNLATQCAPYANADEFHTNCVNDILATGNLAFGAAVVNAFLTACSFVAAKTNQVIALPTSAAQTTLTGVVTNVITSFQYSFTIQPKDVKGKATNFSVTDFKISSGIVVSTTATSAGIVVSYTAPTATGTYTFSVKIGVDHVTGSPFTVTVSNPPYYRIASVIPGFYLDTENGASAAGTRVVAASLSTSNSQLWRITPQGYVQNKNGRVMDVKGGNPGLFTPLIIWDMKGIASASNQLWTLDTTDQSMHLTSNNAYAVDFAKNGTYTSGTPLTLWWRKAAPQDTTNQQFYPTV